MIALLEGGDDGRETTMRRRQDKHRQRAPAAADAAVEGAANGGLVPPNHGPPLAELDFDDRLYRRFHLSARELKDGDDRRFEFWDGATETAYEVRDAPGPDHELPSEILTRITERIAMRRGKPIASFGTMGLPATDEHPMRVMSADQSIYLHPERANIVGPSAMVVGENHYPDVVLEVDLTTDVRRNKLKLYEAWGFPELWVVVPERSERRRSARGTTIYVRNEVVEDGKAKTVLEAVPESRAFPGWKATDIHIALNEGTLSARTMSILDRIGATLGQRSGTGPDDDLQLRAYRRQVRQEGLRQGRTEGMRQGRTEGVAAMVRHILAQRGLQLPPDFPLDVELDDAAQRAIVDAAMGAWNEADLRARLDAALKSPR